MLLQTYVNKAFYSNFRRFGIFLDDPLMSLHKFLANKCNKLIGKSLFKSYNGKFMVFFTDNY